MKLPGIVVVIFSITILFQNEKKSIIRMNKATIESEAISIIPKVVDFQDTLHNDTLFIHLNSKENPVKYSRKLVTSVCIDGKCRMVNIEIFWNITGRYLGFKIPGGEFLSKTEHVAFNSQEYDRLHELLGDRNSALATYSLKELVPPADSTIEVDAVSSATIAAVLDYIVEGAVYTTYALWQITYGDTKKEIEKLTQNHLNAELVLKILNSNELKDQVWVLNHITNKTEISDDLLARLIELISGNDIYLAERSLFALKPEMLRDETQNQLISIFSNSGFLQKRLILQKLKEAPKLNREAAEILASTLPKLNGTSVKIMLELFNNQKIVHNEISIHVAELLKNDNRFIANQAYQFLKDVRVHDKKTIRSIEKYERKNVR